MDSGIVGEMAEMLASSQRGWVIGHFAEGPFKMSQFEVKLWEYVDQPIYPRKTFAGHEFILVAGGALGLELILPSSEAKTIILRGDLRQFTLLLPGTSKIVKVVSAPVWGVTVRWPLSTVSE
ncbi:MAG: hypothetical protein WCT19_00325 [Candidatus Paceibacterota bacterium]